MYGLECRFTERKPTDCPAFGCAPADIRPYDETRWYLVDTDRRHIEEYALDGADKGAPFQNMVIAYSGEWAAESDDLRHGAGATSLLTFNPSSNSGGMSINVAPPGKPAYELSARCTATSADAVNSEKRASTASPGG